MAFADKTVHDVLKKINENDVELLPVVDRNDYTRIIGVISKRDAIEAFALGRKKMHFLGITG